MSKHSTKRKEDLKRAQVKLITRERLLDIAESSFVKTNFSSSTLVVAKEAGVAHGTIFFHFKNRDELVLEVVKRLVLRITDALDTTLRNAPNLKEFLSAHLETMYSNWQLFRALLLGFSSFKDETKQEVITMLAGVNYHLIDAFEKWADNGLCRTILWHGTMIYLSLFGDYMFDKDRVSEEVTQKIVSFLSKSSKNKK